MLISVSACVKATRPQGRKSGFSNRRIGGARGCLTEMIFRRPASAQSRPVEKSRGVLSISETSASILPSKFLRFFSPFAPNHKVMGLLSVLHLPYDDGLHSLG